MRTASAMRNIGAGFFVTVLLMACQVPVLPTRVAEPPSQVPTAYIPTAIPTVSLSTTLSTSTEDARGTSAAETGLGVCPTLSDTLMAEGVLAVYSSDTRRLPVQDVDLLGLDLQSLNGNELTSITFVRDVLAPLAVSPDHTQLALLAKGPKGFELVLASVDPDRAHYSTWNDAEFGTAFVSWTSDGTGLLFQAPADGSLPDVRTDRAWLYRLEDQHIEGLEPSWPYSDGTLWFPWRNGATALFSPNMSLVIFLDVEGRGPGSRVVLYDLQRKSEIWSAETRHLQVPVWDSAGDQVIYVADGGDGTAPGQSVMGVVDRQGMEKRLYPDIGDGDIRAMGFSPQDRYTWYLAATAGFSDQEQVELRLWDTSTDQELSCHWSAPDYGQPVWSPDGHQFALRAIESEGEAPTLIIVDLVKNQYRILDTSLVDVVAWLQR